ncbi:MAG: hypothetical protein ACR2OZ_17485 [Verrucomicrobiales bacterium]
MKSPHTRRQFLAEVGKGMLVATVGTEVASEFGLGIARAADAPAALNFGDLEPLVVFMQETPVNRLMPALVEKINAGTDLRKLVGAAALANARTFGGEDYVGFHTMMALSPAFRMSQELPETHRALPVMKVLYRNTNRIQERGGRTNEILRALAPAGQSEARGTTPSFRDGVHRKDMAASEQIFAGIAAQSLDEAFNELLHIVQENPEVHRVVLPYRAWDLLDVVGRDQALTLLRQSVHYCVQGEDWAARSPHDEPRTLLPRVLEEHHLVDRQPGTREVEDAWIEKMVNTFFTSTPQEAANAAAAALAEGIAPAAIGEAIALTANQLVLRDQGRRPRDESNGKPPGSVHGDSIGVHASDAANAWRNLARVGNPRNTFACLIIGAYQVARDRTDRGGDFAQWEPLPLRQHIESIKTTDPGQLLKEAEEAIRGNLQARAAALISRYGALGHEARGAFNLLLRYAVSEDGALHAEKYYRTVSEEFVATRPAFRWRQLTALARVTASEFGRPAPGIAEACGLLKV